MVFYLQINVIFAFELLVGSFKFQGFHSKFFIKILFNHRTPLNSLNSLRDRLTQKITKCVRKVCDLSVFRWTENNSELWYIAILQKRSLLKNSVFWFSLVLLEKFLMSRELEGIFVQKHIWNRELYHGCPTQVDLWATVLLFPIIWAAICQKLKE